MLAYNEYDKIKKLLKEEKYDKLDDYLDKLYYKTYLEEARKALGEYVRYHKHYCHTGNGELLLTDCHSVFLLNNDEILTDYRRKKVDDEETMDSELMQKALEFITHSSYNEQIDVGKIETVENFYDLKKYYEVNSHDGSVTSTYNIYLFDYAKKFLGRDVTYTLTPYREHKVHNCMAKSDKGMGIILPVKVKQK